MSISWQTVISVLIALVIFKLIDKFFLDAMVSKIGNFEDSLDAEI
jgi:hypothetical protein